MSRSWREKNYDDGEPVIDRESAKERRRQRKLKRQVGADEEEPAQ